MNTEEKKTRAAGEDPPRRPFVERRAVAEDDGDEGGWLRVYMAVVVVTVLVITGLWLFSRAFSS